MSPGSTGGGLSPAVRSAYVDAIAVSGAVTVLYRLQRNGRRVTYSVSVTPQGLRLEERLGSKRLVQVNVQTEAELYKWADKFLQLDLQNGWERMPDERHD